ncbi:MAG: DUF4388 domain-containing protein [Planctomycetota bacterium]
MQEATAFPASAASSLISGYCQDFIGLAASMAQTLEQVTMRNLELGESRDELVRVESGMRQLADAIGGVLARIAAPQREAAPPTRRAQGPAPRHGAPAPGPAPGPAQARPTRGQRAAPPGAPRRPAGGLNTPLAREGGGAPRPAARPGARPGPRAMPIAPAGDTVPPVDAAVKRPVQPTVDATRVPPRPTATCMLQGSNDTMPLRSVFQFLSRMRKSGTLRVTLDTEEMTFDLSDGCMVATTSNRPPNAERIGDLLVELGFVDSFDLETFAKEYGDGLRQLGGALVQNRRITEGQLAEALEQQVARRFRRAIAAPRATYDFRECPRPRGDGRIRIRAFEVLNGDGDDDADA